MPRRAERCKKRLKEIEERLVNIKDGKEPMDGLVDVAGRILLELKDMNDRLMIAESEVGPPDAFIEVDVPTTISPRLGT